MERGGSRRRFLPENKNIEIELTGLTT